MPATKRNKKRKEKPEQANHERRFNPDVKPIWEEILEIADSIPEEELKNLPRDLAENLDFYLYGGKP